MIPRETKAPSAPRPITRPELYSEWARDAGYSHGPPPATAGCATACAPPNTHATAHAAPVGEGAHRQPQLAALSLFSTCCNAAQSGAAGAMLAAKLPPPETDALGPAGLSRCLRGRHGGAPADLEYSHPQAGRGCVPGPQMMPGRRGAAPVRLQRGAAIGSGAPGTTREQSRGAHRRDIGGRAPVPDKCGSFPRLHQCHARHLIGDIGH